METYHSRQRARFGEVLGTSEFIAGIVERFDRRRHVKRSFCMRNDDYTFEPALAVIRQFEKADGMRLGAKLLFLLRERAGLRYKEIIKMPLFHPLKYSSLGKLYQRTKRRIEDRV